jgi:hypothetical protein
MSPRSWLPGKPSRRKPQVHSLWAPPGGGWEPAGHKYVVVEEIEPRAVILLITDWPGVDRRGRPHFGGETLAVATDPEPLRRLLRQREPAELAERELRIGDVFAMSLREDAPFLDTTPIEVEADIEPVQLDDWIDPPIVDVTRDAREMAKVAFYAAVTPTMSKPAATSLEREIDDARGDTPS